ncbi:MAG TPA: hypothetical protein VEH80_01565 [Candidatus Bathyarchaeia archaeon]|nr:hypothetical protein [Candidatus Bathyarchaeia archaeon]
MLADGYGLPLTTESADAATRYDAAVRGFLEWSARNVDLFGAAIAEDPSLAVAHAGLAISLFMDERFAEARESAKRARETARGATERERGHVSAIAAFVEGRIPEAETRMREHVARHPRDLLIAQRLYSLYFYQGRGQEMLDLTTALMPAHDRRGYVLGLHSFALEELDHCREALRLAEAAMDDNPEDTWAVHAFAHAIYEMGASRVGVRELPPAVAGCTRVGWYRNHLLWHVVLMHLATGEYEQGSALCHEWFEREPSALSLDIRNTVSALWRLRLAGLDVSARLRPFAAMLADRLDRPEDLAFHHAHLALTFAGAGEWDLARTHLDRLRARARSAPPVFGEVAVPIAEGFHAFASGDWRGVIEKVEPIRHRIVELGGSRTQRDIFHDTLLEACLQAGDAERGRRLLAERIQRRADHVWVARSAAAA